MTITFDITGIDVARKSTDALGKTMRTRAQSALNVEAEEIMTKSKSKFVPVDLGTLMNSGHVKPAAWVGNLLQVFLRYGGAASDYALAIHEHPSGASPRSWGKTALRFNRPGSGSKYLSRPMDEAEAGMDKRIADRMKIA